MIKLLIMLLFFVVNKDSVLVLFISLLMSVIIKFFKNLILLFLCNLNCNMCDILNREVCWRVCKCEGSILFLYCIGID